MIIPRRLLPIEKGNLWIVPSSQTILEEIRGHNQTRILWM